MKKITFLSLMLLMPLLFGISVIFSKNVLAESCASCLSGCQASGMYSDCSSYCTPSSSGCTSGTGTGTGTGTGATCDNGTKVSGVCFPNGTGLSDATVGTILSTFLTWLLGIFTTVAIMAFVISGIQYLVSAGDEGLIDTAKTNAKWSIVGIIVGLSGFIMLQAVDSLLNGTNSYF